MTTQIDLLSDGLITQTPSPGTGRDNYVADGVVFVTGHRCVM
jgi:hypothetical protein